MHDLAFAFAARPAQCVIFKLLMLDYSIGHEILLLREQNPLVTLSPDGFSNLSRDGQKESIIRATLTCSQTWEQNKIPPKWMRLWGWAIRNRDRIQAIADWQNYRMSGSLYPPTPDAESDVIANGDEDNRKGRELGGPFLARLLNFVSGLPERDFKGSAFDFPLGLATFLYFSEMEVKGEMRIENTKESEVRSEMAAHRAAIAKEKEAACPL